MTEDSPLITPENRCLLLNEMGRAWNYSQPVLLEKSPRHTTMARFFQAMFGEDQTKFVIMIRHPFATFLSPMKLWLENHPDNSASRSSLMCGKLAITNWLL